MKVVSNPWLQALEMMLQRLEGEQVLILCIVAVVVMINGWHAMKARKKVDSINRAVNNRAAGDPTIYELMQLQAQQLSSISRTVQRMLASDLRQEEELQNASKERRELSGSLKIVRGDLEKVTERVAALEELEPGQEWASK